MNNFFSKCLKRPTVLWCLFFTVFFMCTLISAAVLYRFHSIRVLLIYGYMIFPILHLWLFVKPLTVYEVLCIIFSYLTVLTSISLVIWENIWRDLPIWLYFASVGFCFFMLMLFFLLDIAAHLKHRNEYRERYLREMEKIKNGQKR